MRIQMQSLTSLRFFAAFTVVAYHMDKVGAEAWPVLPAHAVSVFFVLSGFVLQAVYGSDLRGMHPLAFTGRRWARIWPLHAALALVMVLVLPGWTHVTDHVLRALSLTQAWSQDPDVFFWQGNGASWSLSAELFFYCMFPLLTGLVRRHPLAMSAAAVTAVIGYILLVGDASSALANFHAYYVNPLARIPEFVLGMCAAELLPYVGRLRLPRGVWTVVEVGAVLGLLAVNAACKGLLPWLTVHLGAGAAAWVEGEGSAPAAVLLIMVLAVGRGAVSRGMSCRPLVVAGEASFAMYLVHQPLLLLAHTPAGLAGYVVMVAAATYMAHRYVEKPGTKAANRVVDLLASSMRRRPATSAALAV
jgi:peptidoglycan/LPS O-acetylase OafA/YrhL